MSDNVARAESARRALDCYVSMGAGDPDDFEASAVDLIADLCHVFDQQTGTYPEDALRIALNHFKAERGDPDA